MDIIKIDTLLVFRYSFKYVDRIIMKNMFNFYIFLLKIYEKDKINILMCLDIILFWEDKLFF